MSAGVAVSSAVEPFLHVLDREADVPADPYAWRRFIAASPTIDSGEGDLEEASKFVRAE
jgi:hypothetical protein